MTEYDLVKKAGIFSVLMGVNHYTSKSLSYFILPKAEAFHGKTFASRGDTKVFWVINNKYKGTEERSHKN